MEQQTLLSVSPASETASKELGNSSPDAAACLAYFPSSFFTSLYFFSSSHHQKPLASVFRHCFSLVLSARSAQRRSLFLGLCFLFAWQEPATRSELPHVRQGTISHAAADLLIHQSTDQTLCARSSRSWQAHAQVPNASVHKPCT